MAINWKSWTIQAELINHDRDSAIFIDLITDSNSYVADQ